MYLCLRSMNSTTISIRFGDEDDNSCRGVFCGGSLKNGACPDQLVVWWVIEVDWVLLHPCCSNGAILCLIRFAFWPEGRQHGGWVLRQFLLIGALLAFLLGAELHVFRLIFGPFGFHIWAWTLLDGLCQFGFIVFWIHIWDSGELLWALYSDALWN